jgi:hypothetical protein
MGTLMFTCPVCGFPGLKERPRSLRTGGGSYEICPSCGFQFGVSDDDNDYTPEQWRRMWIDRGMPWSSQGIKKPDDWDPIAQLQKLA